MFKFVLLISLFLIVLSDALPASTTSSQATRAIQTVQDNLMDSLEKVSSNLAMVVFGSRNINFYSSLHSALMGPFNIITQMIKDLIEFLESRSLLHFFNFPEHWQMVTELPRRAMEYWEMLWRTEVDCLYRSVCDVSSYLSPRVPEWLNQMLGLYFTTHGQDNHYYRALANGMITRNCTAFYPLCSSEIMFNSTAFGQVYSNNPSPSQN